MTSKIGELSNLNLQDSAHNSLIDMLCRTNTSEAQRLLAETINKFSNNHSFAEFFKGLAPAVTESPFNINVTEVNVTITDSLNTTHVLNFAAVTDESDRNGLIGESKDLLNTINELYRSCHHASGASHGSTASTPVIDPSRVTPIHRHTHDQASPVARAGAESEPREALEPGAQSLLPDSQRDLGTINSGLNLLLARQHAQEIRDRGQLSCDEAPPTLSSQELAEIAAKHPKHARNQKLDKLVAAMGILRPDAPGLRDSTLLSSPRTHLGMPFRPTQSQQEHLPSLRTLQLDFPSVSTTPPKPPLTESEALSVEQNRLALVEQLDAMAVKYPRSASGSTLQLPEPIFTVQPEKARRDRIDEILDRNLPEEKELAAITDDFTEQLRTVKQRYGFTIAQPRELEEERTPTPLTAASLPAPHPQTPALSRTLTASPESSVANTQQPIMATPTPLEQVAAELSLRDASLQPPATPRKPELRGHSSVGREVRSVHEIKRPKPSELTAEQIRILKQERERELAKQAISARTAESRDRQRSHLKQGRH